MNETDRASEERRRFTRIHFGAEARITPLAVGALTIDVVLLDLCLQGALVELPQEIPPQTLLRQGDRVQLDLLLDEGETAISMEVEVVHLKDQSVGLQCWVLDVDSMTHLRRLVELNLGDAALFHREIALLGRLGSISASDLSDG